MSNPKHLQKLEAGIEAWNTWQRELHLKNERTERRVIKPDLSGEDLSGRKMSGVDLSFADLTGCDLSNCDLAYAQIREARIAMADFQFASLRGANLYGADLQRANLRDANLLLTNFTGAVLTEARLNGANISRTVFHGSILDGADFGASSISYCSFAGVDLRNVIGLDVARYVGPSSVGVDVLYLSEGRIPGAFLKGTGIPDNLILYAESLTKQPIQFYSCFISYSSADQDFADRLYADLQANGVRCWFAPHDGRFGLKLYDQIDQAIRVHEKLLLIISAHSMSSEWVKTEISRARQREVREKIQVLFPLSLVPFDELRDWSCFDADTGKDSAREIREYLIADFSGWTDHTVYKQQFRKLLRDLRSVRTLAISRD
ncbi:MAG TPA: toll/interleukin-1 receptor domain-containing protein [Bryobacteraceae bacterium]|nr:toll/interleukin-1 receptor domain-containing protein [Bryobacteraceae bacterium]